GEDRVEYIPLSLAYLKSKTDPLVHPMQILDTVLDVVPPNSDAFVEAVDKREFDLIGLSCTANKFANTVHYARQLKARYPNVPIAIGGIHMTSYPDETMRFECFDYGFMGEAEISFPRSGGDLASVPGL